MTIERSEAEGLEPELVRAIGVRGLAATIFNIMVGGGIFILPAVAASQLGPAAPLAYVVCALVMGLIVICFAEAGSRVSLTGGPYAYVEVAFGPFVGFLAGVLLWLLSSFASAAVASGFASALTIFWPAMGDGGGIMRALVLVAMLALVAFVNVRGVREGTRLVEVVTVAKLLPLLFLVTVGAFFVRVDNLTGMFSPQWGDLGRASIVLIFAFGGVEASLVPSGEVRNPARTVPLALTIAMIGVTGLYIALQLVAQGILGAELATARDAPLAAAAFVFAGAIGARVVAAGAAISMFGSVSGMTLTTPRALYAFARNGIFPRWLARIHPAYRTPHLAIATQAAIVCLLAVTSTFAKLAILANVSVLTLYLFCCAAAWMLRRRDVRSGGPPFRVPGGPTVHLLAVAMILWLLSNATRAELGIVAAVLVLGAALYGLASLRGRLTSAPSGSDAQ
ncbi:MAG: APC family permease [Gemmatimonadaceae bacterium]